MTLQDYRKEKKLALKEAAKKLNSLSKEDRYKLAIKLRISAELLRQYKDGRGNNFETALQIVEG